MRYTYALLLFIPVLFSCRPAANENESHVNTWIGLLNEPDLASWQQTGSLTFTGSDSVFTLSGGAEGGLLLYTAEDELEDFTLETDFMSTKGSAAGLVFRYVNETPGDPAMVAYKVSLDHNPDQQNTLGSIYNVARAKTLKGAKAGEWNKLSIEAKGDHLKIYVNDTLAAETHDRRSEEGMIGFAVAPNHEIKIRSLRIMALEETEKAAPQIEDYMRRSEKAAIEPFMPEQGFKGWSQIGDATWDLKDGVLHGYSGKNAGFLIHNSQIRNFYLKVKFKLDHEHNSGIFIRYVPDSTGAVGTQNGIECNIYDHDGYLHEFSTGANPPHARAWSKMVDQNDWNTMEIFAFNEQICMYINGIKASDAHLPEKYDRAGQICIQAGIQVFNGNIPSDVYFKDMVIKNFDNVPFLGF